MQHRTGGTRSVVSTRRRRSPAARVTTRRRSVKTSGFELPLTAASRGLRSLRGDIDVLVDAAARQPSASRRAALVALHHQLRLLAQRVNAALSVTSPPTRDPQRS
ncbi:hypothetical protein [Micromonospora andamanensis]|nr:hypothetical protein [Micromonospora andamanensis]